MAGFCLQRLWCGEKIRGDPEQAGGGRKLGQAYYNLSKRVAVWSQAVVLELRRGKLAWVRRGEVGVWMTCLKSVGFLMKLHDQDEGEDLHTSRWSSWIDGETRKQNPIGLLISGSVDLC